MELHNKLLSLFAFVPFWIGALIIALTIHYYENTFFIGTGFIIGLIILTFGANWIRLWYNGDLFD